MNLVYKNCDDMEGESFELHYDMIVLDRPESLLCHFDAKTMEKKEITSWSFFDDLLRQCDKIVLMDGDVSNRTLSVASAYGQTVYINNNNNETNKKIHLVCNFAKWKDQLRKDLERFYKDDPQFRICIASQSSTKALSIEEDLIQRFPHLNVKRLTGVDSGTTKKAYCEEINETLQATNVFIFTPVIESGVDITIPFQTIYGVLCSRSYSQRAYMQMLARCRNVKDQQIDIANGPYQKINNNYKFWPYKEVLILNKSTVGDTMRKNISVFNEVERLNKHPSLFVNYLKQLARSKGISVNIDEAPRERDAPNITPSEYAEFVTQKKMVQTTTEENFKVDRHFWQQYLVQDEAYPRLLVEFMCGNNPLNHFLSMLGIRNHHEEDNLRSAQVVERAHTIDALLSTLGFSSVIDRGKIDKGTFMENWRTGIVGEPEFQSQRLNEIFNLTKIHTRRADMTTWQIRWWANVLLNPFWASSTVIAR